MSLFEERQKILMGKMVKAVDMKRQDWIWFRWETMDCVTAHELGYLYREPGYLCCGVRPIEEADTAAKQFDTWLSGQPTTDADYTLADFGRELRIQLSEFLNEWKRNL